MDQPRNSGYNKQVREHEHIFRMNLRCDKCGRSVKDIMKAREDATFGSGVLKAMKEEATK